MVPPLEKFQSLLREMFQFDRADLDFGIYRILNHKRDAIETFIEEMLPRKIVAALDDEQKTQSSATLKDLAREVRGSFGSEAIGPYGKIGEEYLGMPLGIKYNQAWEQASGSGDRNILEAGIYNHLYIFFGRYYQDGDFISKLRYSRRHQYAIPYNGEEVHLHWANNDQYYVKTAEHFHDYDWKTPNGLTVRFELRKADVEHDNVKGNKRFFLPMVGKMQWDGKAKKAIIPFEYRPLTPQEGEEYGKRGQQDKIVLAAVKGVSSWADEMSTDLAAALRRERAATANPPSRSPRGGGRMALRRERAATAKAL